MKEDLFKKLENLKVPAIELKGHREFLRRALLSSEYFRSEVSFWARLKNLAPAKLGLAPVVALLLLALIFGSNFIYGQVVQAKAMEIAKNDPAVKKLNIDFAVAKIEMKPLSSVAVTSSRAVVVPERANDRRAIVEIQDDGTVYSLTVNLTHREVEDIQEEAREVIKENANPEGPAGDDGIKPEDTPRPKKGEPKKNPVKPAGGQENNNKPGAPFLEQLRDAIATSTDHWRGNSSEETKDEGEGSGQNERISDVNSMIEIIAPSNLLPGGNLSEPSGEVRGESTVSRQEEGRREGTDNQERDSRQNRDSSDNKTDRGGSD